ncbi:MAG: c-type cytochrome [Dichotomicrobium sp.]
MSKFLRIGVAVVGISALATGVAYTLAERDAAPDAAARMTAMMKLAAATAAEQDAKAGKFGLGRPAHPEEIAAWDIDVRPDGTGLPDGSGTVTEGEQVYVEQCAVCHGDFGEGIGRWPELAGGEGTLDSDDPVKTIGSYWPYLSTVYDYIHRAMPFGNAQSLSDDQVYALTAYVLYLNYIVEDMDFELSKENFGDIEMPNEGQFFMDDREQTEFDQFKREPCMTECKDSVEITKRAQVLDVTPEDEAARKRREEVAASSGTDEAGGAAKEEETDATADTTAASDPDLVAQGEKVFRQCKACHQVGEDAANRVGPHLNDVVGRQIAAVDGFSYSPAFEQKAEEGFEWTEETLAAYLKDPRGYIDGNRMAFAGLRDDDEISAVIAYMKSFEE